jgi:hypothetical protein
MVCSHVDFSFFNSFITSLFARLLFLIYIISYNILIIIKNK